MAALAVIGPGLITAQADNDATGIATYSIAGARYGYRLLWVLVPVGIALAVTQEMGARLGIVTGKGLASLIRERFGVGFAAVAIGLLLIGNLGTTTADFAGIAASLEIFGISKFASVPVAAGIVFLLVTRASYRRVEKVFLVLSAFYVAYMISGFMAHPNWAHAMRSTVVPSFTLTGAFVLTVVAVVGTTVTPWGQFFIQSYVVDKNIDAEQLNYARGDVILGAFTTDLVAFFIIVATASTIFATGGHIVDAKDAAIALKPLAGRFASTLFGLGLLNASFLAAAILPLSTAYAVCEAFGLEMGLDRSPREAPIFYSVFAFSILFGAGVVLIPSVPLVKILFASSAVNGVLVAPILVFLYRLCNDVDLMGSRRNGKFANAMGAATIGLLILLTVLLLGAGIINPT